MRHIWSYGFEAYGPLDQFIEHAFPCLFDAEGVVGLMADSIFIIGPIFLTRSLRKIFSRRARGEVYLGELGSLFDSIVALNLGGLFIYNLSPTGYLTTALFYSLTYFTVSVMIGLSLHGWRFFGVFLPAGTPLAFAGFIVVIELVSFCARAVILGMRLFANIFAGHCLVKIIMSFTWIGLWGAGTEPSNFILFVPVLVGVLTLEILIAILQAYVFVTLVNAYLYEAVTLGH